jgi:hypothetical protein
VVYLSSPNLLRIKLEFSEILEWTFGHKGEEFAILGGTLTTYALYLDYIAEDTVLSQQTDDGSIEPHDAQ